MDDAVDLLALLVPLPGDHDDVPGPGARNCGRDGRATVEVDLHVRPGALEDRLDDLDGLLGARVVVRHDDGVRELPRDLAHERPLVAIAVTAGTEHHDDPAVAERARGAEHGLARIPAAIASSSRSSNSADATAASTFSTLNTPSSGDSIAIPAAAKREPRGP